MGTTCSRSSLPRATAGTLLTLLNECDAAAASLLDSAPALASLTADLVARYNASTQAALAQVNASRSAQLARETRVLGDAKRFSRKQCKRAVADLETVDVSVEQLRVWAAVAATSYLYFPCALYYALAASPLLAPPRLMQVRAIGLMSNTVASFAGWFGAVVTGDGLRVVSAAGPGLRWFVPHSRNEFCVVLAQADGSVPTWLTTSDVVVTTLSASVSAGAFTAAATVTGTGGNRGAVSVVYEGLRDSPEAVLQLTVCGVVVADAPGACIGIGSGRVLRQDHLCRAVGVHVRTLPLAGGRRNVIQGAGVAVSADEKWLVLGFAVGILSVFSLPEGELVRTFGERRGQGPLQYNGLARICFAPNGHLVVADQRNKRLQQVTLEGVFVRSIGVGMFRSSDGDPFSVAVHDDVIAVGCVRHTGPRVMLFDFGTGALMCRFGKVGEAPASPGKLSEYCTGIRFTRDGCQLIVAEHSAARVSVFTTAGVFVRCVGGVRVLEMGFMDVQQTVTGEYVVADQGHHRVCVFTPDGSELLRSWGKEGSGNGQFFGPTALAAAGRYLYVMDSYGRVMAFE